MIIDFWNKFKVGKKVIEKRPRYSISLRVEHKINNKGGSDGVRHYQGIRKEEKGL